MKINDYSYARLCICFTFTQYRDAGILALLTLFRVTDTMRRGQPDRHVSRTPHHFTLSLSSARRMETAAMEGQGIFDQMEQSVDMFSFFFFASCIANDHVLYRL